MYLCRWYLQFYLRYVCKLCACADDSPASFETPEIQSGHVSSVKTRPTASDSEEGSNNIPMHDSTDTVQAVTTTGQIHVLLDLFFTGCCFLSKSGNHNNVITLCYTCMHTHTHAHSHMHACMHTCMHACECTHTHIHAHTHTHTCMQARMHTCMHTLTHTHTHIQIDLLKFEWWLALLSFILLFISVWWSWSNI